MKKVVILLSIIMYTVACKQDTVSTDPPSGTWKVVYYVDSGKNETSDFSGYTFDFQSSGKFVAKSSGTTVEGTWSENTSSKKLIITISGNKVLDNISDDWLLIEKTSSSIKLKDDNSSSGEEIHLSKM